MLTPEDIFMLLALAGILVPVLNRLGVPSILAYLLLGLAVGPQGLGRLTEAYPWLTYLSMNDDSGVEILAECGVMFLLFMIGLELSFGRLWQMRRLVLGLGTAQIVISALAIALVAAMWEHSWHVSIVLGLSLALSSTAMVMQSLGERRMKFSPVGHASFAILLMQDLAVVPILFTVEMLSQTGLASSSVTTFLSTMGESFMVLILIMLAGRWLLRPLFRLTGRSQNPEWLMALSLLILAFSVFLTHQMGLSTGLGAFLAGILLGETEYQKEIEVTIEPFKGLLLGVFFLSVGMSINLLEVMNSPYWLAISVIGLFAIKAIILTAMARLFGLPRGTALHMGILLGQGGEFAFMVLGIAQSENIMSVADAQFFKLTVGCSMLLTPLAVYLAQWADNRFSDHSETVKEPPPSLPGRALIAGFGRVGQQVAKTLEKANIPYAAIDQQAAAVVTYHAAGMPVYYGNVRRQEIWRALGADEASLFILTTDDPKNTRTILRTLRRHWPHTPIIVRAHDAAQSEQLIGAGATLAVPETLEASLQLAARAMETLGIAPEAAAALVARQR